MRSASLNGYKLVFAKGKHNAFHWLVVVLLRSVKFSIFAPIGLCLSLIGYSISRETISGLLPTTIMQNIEFYSLKLPNFLKIKNIVFSLLGDGYQRTPTWWTMVVGLPLVVIGLIIITTVLFDLYYALFVREFHQTHCPLCEVPIKFKKMKKSTGG